MYTSRVAGATNSQLTHNYHYCYCAFLALTRIVIFKKMCLHNHKSHYPLMHKLPAVKKNVQSLRSDCLSPWWGQKLIKSKFSTKFYTQDFLYARPTMCTLPEIVIALRTFYYTLHKQKFTWLNTVVMATIMATQRTRIVFTRTCILGLQTLHKNLIETSLVHYNASLTSWVFK